MTKFALRMPLFLVLILSLSLAGCGSFKKKKAATGEEVSNVVEDSAEATYDINADSDSGTAGALRTVNFPFDSSSITASSRDVLDANADVLQAATNLNVQVEGHCDERGGIQYNLALGEKRANAVKDYLIALGISSSRITTVSFGKEKPVGFNHSEEAWGQNRRANFVITDN